MCYIIVYDFILFSTHTHTHTEPLVPQKFNDPGLMRSKVECVCVCVMCIYASFHILLFFLFSAFGGELG